MYDVSGRYVRTIAVWVKGPGSTGVSRISSSIQATRLPCSMLASAESRICTANSLRGPSRSRPRPRHSRGRTALMHSISSTTSASASRRQKSPAVVGSGRLRAQRIHVRRVVAQPLDVLQPRAAAQHVVRQIEHVIRLVIRPMHLQKLQPFVDRFGEPELRDQSMHAPMPP